MAQVKFVLISPTSPSHQVQIGERPRGSRYFRFSMLSSLYVAAAMPPGVEIQLIDEDVDAVDFDTDADLIGITFMTYNAPRAYAIADRFRSERHKPVIVGGYHPTFLPEEAIRHADAVCIGDAEDTVPRMIEDFEAGALKPFYRSALPSLGCLRPLDRSLIRARDYAPVDVLQATRGCAQHCTFCSVTAFHQHRHRTRPVAEVIDELKTLGPYVQFMDDNLIGDLDYAKELFGAMIPLRKHWFSQCGLQIVQDRELFQLARRSGCNGLFIGFETLSQPGLRSWGKMANVGQDYLAIIEELHTAGIAVFAGVVFGGDQDEPDVFARTLEFLLQANAETLQATRLTPFPGTPLFTQMDREGRIFDRDWSHYDFNSVVFEPRQMSPAMLDAGVAWVVREFHTTSRVTARVWKCLRYLDPWVVLAGVAPINLGFRHGFARDGTFERAKRFQPS
ncbi:MAG: radical SAM protein [Chloroflexota bacterium]